MNLRDGSRKRVACGGLLSTFTDRYGERVQKSLSIRTHVCPACGLVLGRDENAARNILRAALEYLEALNRTAGQAGTGRSQEGQNASGQRTSGGRTRVRSVKSAG